MMLECPPVQKPHPPIAIAAANSVGSVELAGQLGLYVLTGDFIPVPRLRLFSDALVRAQVRQPPLAARGLAGDARDLCGGQDIVARDDMRNCYNEIIAWEIVNTPHHQVERIPPGGTFQDINFDYLVDTANLYIGSPETVTSMAAGIRTQVGSFGILMFHAGRPYATPAKLALDGAVHARGGAPAAPPRSRRAGASGRGGVSKPRLRFSIYQRSFRGASSPESITPGGDYGFRAPSLRSGPGMTTLRLAPSNEAQRAIVDGSHSASHGRSRATSLVRSA